MLRACRRREVAHWRRSCPVVGAVVLGGEVTIATVCAVSDTSTKRKLAGGDGAKGGKKNIRLIPRRQGDTTHGAVARLRAVKQVGHEVLGHADVGRLVVHAVVSKYGDGRGDAHLIEQQHLVRGLRLRLFVVLPRRSGGIARLGLAGGRRRRGGGGKIRRRQGEGREGLRRSMGHRRGGVRSIRRMTVERMLRGDGRHDAVVTDVGLEGRPLDTRGRMMRRALTRLVVVATMVVIAILDAIDRVRVGVDVGGCVGDGGIRAAHAILRRVILHRHTTAVVRGPGPVCLGGHGPGGDVRGVRLRDGRDLAHQRVLSIQNRTLGRVAVLVPVAQVQPHKGAIAVSDIASVDRLGVVIELVAVSTVGSLAFVRRSCAEEVDPAMVEG